MQGGTVLVSGHVLVDECLALLVGVAVFAELLERALVEWGSGDVEMSILDDARHEAIEQCHDERVDVRTIDVGVGHDDNLVVAQLVDICLTVGFAFYTEAHTDRLDDVHHRLCLKHAMPLHFLNVQNLTAQR